MPGYRPNQGYVISVLFLLCFRARLFIGALWSPGEKGLTSWLSFVMSNCEGVTFPLVSCRHNDDPDLQLSSMGWCLISVFGDWAHHSSATEFL